jgi:hypothetical protein
MTHAEAEQGIKRFAKDELPRLKEVATQPAGSQP